MFEQIPFRKEGVKEIENNLYMMQFYHLETKLAPIFVTLYRYHIIILIMFLN